MKKENFKYLYSFRFNGKEYIYLISKNYPFYFLEYNAATKSFDYPDIDTFKELYGKFYSHDTLLSFDIKDDLKKAKKILCDVKFDITPLIRTTSGLLSIALVLSMCGCKQTNENNPSSTESVAVVENVDKNQEIYDYFKGYDMDVINREYDGNDYIFVEDFLNSNNRRQVTIHSFEEFRKFKQLDFIPTWDDVIAAFQDNENIDEDKKEKILGGIANLKDCEDLKTLDLSVLYVNAKRMNLQYLTPEEMTNSVSRESVYAFFDTVSGTVYLPKDEPIKTFEFIHEVLGHGALAYREETDDSLVIFDCTNYLMLPTDGRYTGYSVGIMVSEGGANMIAHMATQDHTTRMFYELYEEELRVIAELCDVSIGELFNHKGISLYDLMYQNGIDTPVEYIFKMDAIYRGKMYCEFSDLMERLFVDATEEKIRSASKSEQEEIIRATIAIIQNSYFKDEKELHFDYDGGSIDYNFEESAAEYEDNISRLIGK